MTETALAFGDAWSIAFNDSCNAHTGCAFVRYSTRQEALTAIDALHDRLIPVSSQFCVSPRNSVFALMPFLVLVAVKFKSNPFLK